MKDFIRRFLGIETVLNRQMQINYSLKLLSDRIDELSVLRGQIAIANRAMGRLVAKLDPMYGKSEFDPARKAESDRLGDEIIAKLYAEHKAQNPNG